MSSHHEHSIYRLNSAFESLQDPLPLPPKEGLSTIKLNTYEDVDEPKFDPKIHLNLQKPKFVRLMPDYEKRFDFPIKGEKHENGSAFAWSSPFQVILHFLSTKHMQPAKVYLISDCPYKPKYFIQSWFNKWDQEKVDIISDCPYYLEYFIC